MIAFFYQTKYDIFNYIKDISNNAIVFRRSLDFMCDIHINYSLNNSLS